MSVAEQVDERRRLRADGREARRRIEGAQRTGAEGAIVAHLAHMHLPAGAGIGVTVADDGEPDLSPFVEALWAAGHSVALPVPAPGHDDFTMEFQPWRPPDSLAPGRFDIPCPPERDSVVPDVLVVPLVRFDAAGNRMGRGAGFYDRWLAEHPDCIPIGVAFEVQRAVALDPKPHDVPMRAMVTELGIRWFRPTDTA